MSISIALVCEGVTDPPTLCALADRFICEAVDWVAVDEIDTYRHYRGYQSDKPYLTWFEIEDLGKRYSVKSRVIISGCRYMVMAIMFGKPWLS